MMTAVNDRQARIDAMLDKQDIYECLVRMSRGTDRADREMFLSGFHLDSVVTAGPFVGCPADLYDWAAKFQTELYTATFHKLHQMHCDIEGDDAHAETYYFFVGCMGENNLLAGGRYVDRFEKRDGRWGMVMRNNYVEWTSVVPAMASPLGDIPGLELNGVPARDRSDASYIRPLVNKRAVFTPG
jgi:SnoaL-like domain